MTWYIEVAEQTNKGRGVFSPALRGVRMISELAGSNPVLLHQGKNMKKLLDDTPLTFGKHIGKTPNEISANDPSYIVWLHENLDKMVCTNKLYEECKDMVDESDYKTERELDEFNGW